MTCCNHLAFSIGQVNKKIIDRKYPYATMAMPFNFQPNAVDLPIIKQADYFLVQVVVIEAQLLVDAPLLAKEVQNERLTHEHLHTPHQTTKAQVTVHSLHRLKAAATREPQTRVNELVSGAPGAVQVLELNEIGVLLGMGAWREFEREIVAAEKVQIVAGDLGVGAKSAEAVLGLGVVREEELGAHEVGGVGDESGVGRGGCRCGYWWRCDCWVVGGFGGVGVNRVVVCWEHVGV